MTAAGQSDQRWMAEALREARKGLYTTHPNPRVGCVVVSADERIAAGWHEYTGGPHAEVRALESASIPAGADFYVTLEPCSHHGRTPPCVNALLAARPARVVVASLDPNPEVAGRGVETLRAAGIEVVTGVLELQARELNPGFFKRMQQGMPLVTLKMAASLDGGTALANGESRWITGEAARRDVQFQRARASAILTSAQTVLDDDPALDVRLSSQELGQQREPYQPVRAVIDSQLRLGGEEKIFSCGGEIWIYTCSSDQARRRELAARGARIVEVETDDSDSVALAAVMRDLAAQGINEVHSECGPRLAGALLAQGLADRALLYLAPHLLGSAARGLFDLGELVAMEQRKSCRICDIRRIGEDLRLSLEFD